MLKALSPSDTLVFGIREFSRREVIAEKGAKMEKYGTRRSNCTLAATHFSETLHSRMRGKA